MKLLARVGMVGIAALIVSTCVPQNPDEDTYRDRSRQAVVQTNSAVETARIVLRELQRGDMLQPYAVITLRDSEDSLTRASDSYETLDPPPAADPLFSSTSSLMSDASSAVTDARIAVVRQEHRRYASLAHDLASLSRSLDQQLARAR